MRLFLPFIILTFFASCVSYVPGQYLKPASYSFINIPLRPHSNEVDIFLDEEKPSKPYYKIKMIEVQAGPEVSSDEMLKLLKQKAMQTGIDAVIITDIGKQANTTTTIPTGDGVIAYQKLVGLGLKYKERIDYMGTLLKEQIVQFWPDDNPAPKIFSMKYDFNTVNTSLNDEFTRNFFFNEIYLFEDEKTEYFFNDAWEYKLDTFNNLFSKRRVINTETIQQADFKLNGPERTKASIKIKKTTSPYLEKYELERTYSPGNLLVNKTLRKTKKSEVVWFEEITYNSNGQPYKQTRYKNDKGKKVLYFEIENVYYTLNDLPAVNN